MERTTSLEQRLVDTSTTSNNTDGCTARARDGLLGTTGETDTGLVLVGGVTDNGSVVAGCPGKGTTVASLLLNVADNSTLRALSDGENVADGEGGLLAAVNEGTSVEALGGDESLLAELVAVGVTEDDAGEGSTTESLISANTQIALEVLNVPASVVDDLLHNAADVAIALRKVEGTELSWRLVVVRVRTELDIETSRSGNDLGAWNIATYNGVRPPLCSNDPTHRLICRGKSKKRFQNAV